MSFVLRKAYTVTATFVVDDPSVITQLTDVPGFVKARAVSKDLPPAISKVEDLPPEISKVEDFPTMPKRRKAYAVDLDPSPKPRKRPVANKVEWGVDLVDAGDKKIEVIKEIRAITGLDLKEAKDLVEGAGFATTIKEGISEGEAEEIAARLEAVGAEAHIHLS
jgi:ribosomal protein L7/L12